ncbi:hypothetical protein SDJN02_13328, partial [Cucurbita argyrosperma subsp. argyrosperma]
MGAHYRGTEMTLMPPVVTKTSFRFPSIINCTERSDPTADIAEAAIFFVLAAAERHHSRVFR